MAVYLQTIQKINRLNKRIKQLEMELMVVDCTPSHYRKMLREKKQSELFRSKLSRNIYEI